MSVFLNTHGDSCFMNDSSSSVVSDLRLVVLRGLPEVKQGSRLINCTWL